MIVFLFRPSPQVPRPSVRAAVQCYDASEYNIYMQRKQIETRSVELTWIFTQSIFMAINTILWSLSYAEVRRMHSREDVERHLKVALDAIELASERWPGVASARSLYQNLIEACLKVYEKKGDVPISATSPSDSTSAASPSMRDDSSTRSRTMSPATVSTGSLSTPPERTDAPFGYISPQTKIDFNMTNDQNTANFTVFPSPHQTNLQSTQSTPTNSIQLTADMSSPSGMTNISSPGYEPQMQFNPVALSFQDLPTWSPSFPNPNAQAPMDAYGQTGAHQQYQNSMDYSSNPFSTAVGALYEDYMDNDQPGWATERPGVGLNQAQQFELLESLQTHGPEQIESMIEESNALFAPSSRPY